MLVNQNPSGRGKLSHSPGNSFRPCARRIAMIAGSKAEEPELKAVELLRSRILSRSRVRIEVLSGRDYDPKRDMNDFDIVFLVGCPQHHELLRAVLDERGLSLPSLPGNGKIHPESFVVATHRGAETDFVLVAGADGRGVIYGVGAALRALTYGVEAVDVPALCLVEKPAFRLRGGEASSVGPRHGAMELGRMRPQTDEEMLEGVEDLLLLGLNVLGGADGFARTWGLMTYGSNVANGLPKGFPEGWAATPSNSLHIKVASYFRKAYVCPSIPEAREALLKNFDKAFSHSPPYDFFATSSGDVGGCTCPRCTPWGVTFIKLVREMADILHKYHPGCKVLATMQNLTNEGDQGILDYLNEGDSGWFYAIRYAPGGNEMSTYNRGDVNPRWFEYEGFGKTSNYLKHVHHSLPPHNDVVLFSDVTHWIRSQYGVERPDVALAVIYNRRAWNARPKAYHAVARETFHYAVGDLYYSEGMHDDFNKWFWLRMLWNPHLSAEEITREYCRYWFGTEAQDQMTRAIFLMEETLEKPVLGNEGIGKAVSLLRDARKRIPQNIMERDYRWRIIMQKALLDRYIQMRLERGEELKHKAAIHLKRAASGRDSKEEIQRALDILRGALQTPGMKALKNEIMELGEETNRLVGYREPACFVVDDFDVTEIGWWIQVLERGLAGSEDTQNLARMILRYEDPGEGGWHEKVGWPHDPPHLIRKDVILGYFPFTGPARLSHYAMGYSWRKEGSEVAFLFQNLDKDADYVLRITTGFHCDELKEILGKGTTQSLEANGTLISEDVPLPLGEIRTSEFELPRETTRNGKVRIALRSKAEGLNVAGLSEIWLMRRDTMPWRLPELG